MKPCPKNRKRIAWLALGLSEAPEAQSLREHIAVCDGCREYLAQMSKVTHNLESARLSGHQQTSEGFHQRVLGALRAERAPSIWETLAAMVRPFESWWRLALGIFGAAVVVLILFSMVSREPTPTTPASMTLAQAPAVNRDPAPTIANYLAVANKSLEDFDALLTRQGSQPPPAAPVYTAAMLAW